MTELDFSEFSRDRPPIHFLYRTPNGPIVTAPGGSTFTIGTHGRLRVACDESILMGDFHRGSGEPWAVTCPHCRETATFRERDMPRPGQAEP